MQISDIYPGANVIEVTKTHMIEPPHEPAFEVKETTGVVSLREGYSSVFLEYANDRVPFTNEDFVINELPSTVVDTTGGTITRKVNVNVVFRYGRDGTRILEGISPPPKYDPMFGTPLPVSFYRDFTMGAVYDYATQPDERV
jgi:hypothetical protein